jgi:hypothetical protein
MSRHILLAATGLFVLLAAFVPARAGQVCLYKDSGRLIEYQSDATPGTCTRNAAAAGIDVDNVEEREVTRPEWAVIRKRWITDPAEAEMEARLAVARSARAKLKDLGLTDAELDEVLGRASR